MKVQATFKKNQAQLPPKQRSAETEADMCKIQNGCHICTLPRGHKGQHIAHGLVGQVVYSWSDAQHTHSETRVKAAWAAAQSRLKAS
jgi:hypothetical protein